MEPSQTQTETPAKQESTTDGKPDEVLAVLNTVLKRDFKSRDEAVKSIDNLHRMVGDNAIAELREKAKDGELFVKTVQKYASDEGITEADARKALLDVVMDTHTEPTKTVAPEQAAKASVTEARLEAALVKLQEKELLELHPEAKLVLNDVKALRAVTPDKELKDIYETSSLMQAAQKAAEYEKDKATKESTAVVPNNRQANLEADNLKGLVVKAQGGLEADKVALVDAFFKAQQ